MTNVTGYVFEIFCSIQGEGIYVGERQVFVRTAGCSATCRWCDAIPSKTTGPTCLIRGRRSRSIANPLSVARTVEETLALIEENAPVKTVSITGGEPLEQVEFVTRVAAALKENECRVYLETNGLHAGALVEVLSYVDVVAMDIKLPSATGQAHWDDHRAFLKVLRGVEAFVKVVVEHSTPPGQIEQAVDLVAETDDRIPLVLQPEGAAFVDGAHGAAARDALVSTLVDAQGYALGRLADVRVIPQNHKILKLR